LLSPWAVSYLNAMLYQGVEIPIPDWLKAPITQPRFKQYKGYFLFDSQPREDAIIEEPEEPIVEPIEPIEPADIEAGEFLQ